VNIFDNDRIRPNYHIVTNSYITKQSRAGRYIYVIANNRHSSRIQLAPDSYALPDDNSVAYYRLAMNNDAHSTISKSATATYRGAAGNIRVKNQKNKSTDKFGKLIQAPAIQKITKSVKINAIHKKTLTRTL
jgi:hypothetical protein